MPAFMKIAPVPVVTYAFGLLVAVVIGSVAVTAMGDSSYVQFLVEVIMVYIVATAGMNVAMGFAGQFQMAQGAFIGIAAYTAAILVTDRRFAFPVAALLAILGSMAFGSLVALLTMRTRSHYLLLATFAMQVVGVRVLQNWTEVTGGVNGHVAVFKFEVGPFILSGSTVEYTILLLVFAGISLLLARWLRDSYVGLGMQGARQNERALQASGLRPALFKVASVIISSAYGGFAGVLIGPILTYLVPDSFALGITLLLLVMVIMGGLGSVAGVAVAAILLTLASQAAQSSATATYWPLMYGLFIMVILVVAPSGLGGATPLVVRALARRLRAWGLPLPTFGRPGESGLLARPQAEVADFGANGTPKRATALHRRSAPPALSLTDICRNFGGVQALDSVSLEVGEGLVHGLVGPNGSGKTTLFDVITGFTRQNSGRVILLGTDVSRESPTARARRGIGRSFQQPAMLEDNSVLENTLIGVVRHVSAWVRLVPIGSTSLDRPSRQGALELLDLLGLADRIHTPLRELPYGARKLVDIARVLAGNPGMVLLDEPTAGVDAASVDIIRTLIKELKRQGRTVLLVEHNMRFVMSLCDRITVLNSGRVIADGDPDRVSRDEVVIEAYLGSAYAHR